MLRDVIEFLRCPICRADVSLAERSVCCSNGHRFDVARQGYVNLLPGDAQTGSADTPEMVAARMAFFEAGHFAPLVGAVAAEAQRAVSSGQPGCVLDLGSGPGQYLAAVLDRLPERVGLALDISKHALRRGARIRPRVGAAVCDAWRSLPVRSGAAALVLNVFAPRNPSEIARVLHRDGVLLVVTPASPHLHELVSALGLLTVDEDKQQRVRDALRPALVPQHDEGVEFAMSLCHADIETLVAMGPSAWHTGRDTIRDRLGTMAEPVRVTASVTVSVYRRPYQEPR